MLRLTSRMTLEAPHEYVALVERHLPRLRRDAALVVGDGHHADELYPDVLADVAARWGRLELLRRWLGRSGAADVCVRRCFARRARRWQNEQITPVEVEVWRVESLDGPAVYRPETYHPETYLPATYRAGVAAGGWLPEQLAPVHARVGQAVETRRGWNSWAVQLAPVLLANSRVEARPLAEAAIAWWHAYEAQRRRRYALVVAVLLLGLGLLSRLQSYDADVWYAPAAALPIATCAARTASPL